MEIGKQVEQFTILIIVNETKPYRYQTNASDLILDGSFNVNSTSVDAWIAQLSSLRGISVPNGPTSINSTPVVRFLEEPLASDDNNWNELRSLSDTEIASLAKNIVKQVKLRGPFLSFSDFVNRRLIPGPADPNAKNEW